MAYPSLKPQGVGAIFEADETPKWIMPDKWAMPLEQYPICQRTNVIAPARFIISDKIALLNEILEQLYPFGDR